MKAERIGKALNIQNLKLSDGCLAAFKEQHMLQDWRMHGEAGSARSKDADAETPWVSIMIFKHFILVIFCHFL